ncbi:MAG: hypothetical protein AAFR96_03220 [Planctomycetota bacterium]
MMTHTMHARTRQAASALALFAAGSTLGQDLRITVANDGSSRTRGVITAEFAGQIPGGATAIGTVWADTSFALSSIFSSSPITITGFNPGYSSAIFGDPQITGNGTQSVSFVGLQPGGGLGNPDPSNPLVVATFETEPRSLVDFELIGQNSALFTGNPLEPFGTVRLYQDVTGNAGSLTFSVLNIYNFPQPGTAVAFGSIGLFGARRRRSGRSGS